MLQLKDNLASGIKMSDGYKNNHVGALLHKTKEWSDE